MWPTWMRHLREEAGVAGEGGGTGLPPVTPPADDSTARLQAQLDAQQEELKKLRLQTTPPVMPPAAGNPPSKEEIEKTFWKDPLPVIDALARQRAAEMAQQAASAQGPTQEAMRMYARDKVRGNDPFQQKIFDKYYAEIEQLVSAVPTQFQTNPNVWDNAFNQVKGRHFSEIAAMQTPTTSRGDGPSSPSAKATPPPAKTPLSDDERAMARSLKMTEDDYREGKRAYENQEQAWGEVITFDSADKRRRDAARVAATRK